MKLGWSTVISGGRSEAGKVTAVDANGDVWVAGTSSSANDFPGPVDPIQSAVKGKNDIFIAKYHPLPDGGTQLLYWTWLGGSANEDVFAMKIDQKGRLIIAGTTESFDLPLGGTPFQTTNNGGTDTFVAVIDPNIGGEFALVFCSYFGGTKNEIPNDIAIAPDGTFVVVGLTTSDDLYNLNGVQNNSRGGWDGFLIKIDLSSDSPLQYVSYYGGNYTDSITTAAFDKNGILWMAGYTASTDFPATDNAYQSAISISYDMFVASIDFSRSGLDALRYSTYYGGSGSDYAVKIAFDSAGLLWIGGQTSSGDMRVTAEGYQTEIGGEDDAYVVAVDTTKPAAEWVRYGTYFGGDGFEVLYGMELLPNGRIALTGYSMFGGLPTAGTPYQPVPASGFADTFVSVLDTAGKTLEYSTYFGGSYNDVATSVVSDNAGGVTVTGYTNSYDFTSTDGTRRSNPPTAPSAFVYRFVRNIS